MTFAGGASGVGDEDSFAREPLTAHEYLHSWEDYPDLYDYDVWRPDTEADVNCPVGRFGIMATGGLVHPVAPLKEMSGWVKAIDLRTANSILNPLS